jgi:hypothetical protein
MERREFQVISFNTVDGQPFEIEPECYVSGMTVAGAARKAGNDLLQQCFNDQAGKAVIALREEAGQGSERKEYVYEIERTVPVGVRSVQFPWDVKLRTVRPSTLYRKWLKAYPQNTEEAWKRRPMVGRHLPVARVLFIERTSARILRRQVLYTPHDLARALPRELVSTVWDVVEKERHEVFLRKQLNRHSMKRI